MPAWIGSRDLKSRRATLHDLQDENAQEGLFLGVFIGGPFWARVRPP